MAVTAMAGMEPQATGLEVGSSTGPSGTASYSTTFARTGAASLRCNPASGASGSLFVSVSGNYTHFGLRLVTIPSVQRVIGGTIGSGTINLRLNTDGTISAYENVTLIGTSSTALTTDVWYWIGWRAVTGTSVVWLQIDGVDAVTGTATVTVTDSRVGFGGTEASAAEAYIDDWIVDNAGFLAPSKVDIALPISDNTRTGTTAGAGGTTNLWDAVNNTPPAGVASASETNTSNIEFPASTTCDYIANLETYTTLGIGASDTVLAVQSIVRHGEDIATGTKNLQNVGALTNPTVAGTSVLLDSGAHGADTPGLWNTTFGTLTTSPSVTLGTSPTIQTTRTSETRVACIDFMGMLVAWTPAPAAERVPYLTTMPQLLAH